MSVQADIANAQAQRVRDAVKELRPSRKDLRRMGKGNMAGVMTGWGSTEYGGARRSSKDPEGNQQQEADLSLGLYPSYT